MKKATPGARSKARDGKSRTTEWSSHCERKRSDAKRERFRGELSRNRQRAVSPQAPVSFVDARGKTHTRTTAGVGAESLYVPELHSDEGCRYSGAQRRRGFSARLAEANHRSRWRRNETRRHRKVAAIG